MIVTTSDLSGRSGHNIATREIVAGFVGRADTSVVLVCPEPSNRPPPLVDGLDAVYHLPRQTGTLSNHVRTQVAMVPTLRRAIVDADPDVVVARLGPSLAVPPLLTAAYRVPYSLHIRGDVTRNMRFEPVVWFVVVLNVLFAHHVVCETESLQAKFVDRWPAVGKRTRTFNSAVNPSHFEPTDRDEARSEIDVPLGSGDFVVGFVGSLKERHRLDVLFEAMAARDDGRTKALIVGDGPLYDRLKRQVSNLGIDARVSFVGFVDHEEVHRYLSASDVIYGVVDPDRPTNPLKCYESLACARPVITTHTPEFAFIEEVGAGIVIDDLTPRAVADAVDEFRHMEYRERLAMGRRGRSYVLEHHTWAELVDIVVEELNR